MQLRRLVEAPVSNFDLVSKDNGRRKPAKREKPIERRGVDWKAGKEMGKRGIQEVYELK